MKQKVGQVFINMQEETQWIICPKCGKQKRVKKKDTTIMKDFPLFCTWCKKETLIDVENYIIQEVKNDK